MQRTQFTFYESFYKAVKRIKDPESRAQAYDAICAYALYGQEPNLDSFSDFSAIAFELIKPNLDSSRKKAENGKAGGSKKQNKSKKEANKKQEQIESEKENEDEKEKENKIEIEKENKIEIEKENKIEIEKECEYNNTPIIEKVEKIKFGEYGWVKLKPEDYSRLISDYGESEVKRAIRYIDESSQSSGNKNKWKDWNLVVRRCIREGWGARQKQKDNGNIFAELLEEERRMKNEP